MMFHWNLPGVSVGEPRPQGSVTRLENQLPQSLQSKAYFSGGTKRNQWKHFNRNRNQKSLLLEDVQKEQHCWHPDNSHITETGKALSMQAFFWISFRLFPTLPPALLTATAIDTAKPLSMLQKHSGLKQRAVLHISRESHVSSTRLIKVFLAACTLDAL